MIAQQDYIRIDFGPNTSDMTALDAMEQYPENTNLICDLIERGTILEAVMVFENQTIYSKVISAQKVIPDYYVAFYSMTESKLYEWALTRQEIPDTTEDA